MPRPRRRVPVVLPAALAGIVLALGACGEETVIVDRAEGEISRGYERQVSGSEVTDVTCPEDISADIGTEARCTMRLASDIRLDVAVEVVGEDGRIRWRTVDGTVPGDAVERQAAASLERSVGRRPDAVECPARVALGEGKVTRCTIRAGDDELGATITMTSDDGRFDVEVDRTIRPRRP